jgi:hypothetical protein
MSKKAIRIQRFVMGTMLLVATGLCTSGIKIGLFILIFIIFMLYLSAFTGFCPSDKVFEKIAGGNKEGKEA